LAYRHIWAVTLGLEKLKLDDILLATKAASPKSQSFIIILACIKSTVFWLAMLVSSSSQFLGKFTG
jgi:hypothetical protein